MKLSEIRTKCELFCGGTFCFDYRNDGYEMMAAKDYRAKLLDSVESLFADIAVSVPSVTL